MAQIDVYYTGGLDMGQIDVNTLMNGTVLVANSTTFSLQLNDGERINFTGQDFTYNNIYTPTGGVVTGFNDTLNGSIIYQVSGVNVPATTFVNWAATDNNAAAFNTVLAGENALNGGAGGDVLYGLGVSDAVYGNAGNDTLIGRSGSELLWGGDGNDAIQGGAGFNNINGNKGDDIIVGTSQIGDWLSGGQGNDIIDATHSGAHNFINGNIGTDTITGGTGGDTLLGGQGSDLIHGGAGNDYIAGQLGDDTMSGSAGADQFHFAPGGGHDVVADFNGAEGDRVVVDSSTAAYTVSQVGSGVTIDLGNGDTLTLQNQSASFNNAWVMHAS